ncbi:MAG: protein kinase [Polyangiales bacterium]
MTGTDENPTREHAAGGESPAAGQFVSTGAVFAKRYKLIRRISSGGMAEVYEVEHLGTRRRLALKVLLPEVMADAVSVERFQREASVCANIDSDHVVNVIDTDVDADSGMPFLVMELLNGKDLSQYISETWGRGAPIPLSMVLTVLRQVASALDKVHAEGIVHRDLKPANLFLTFPSDAPARVKILDFGVAKLTHEKRTSNAARLGTPLYMTPEQLTGRTEPTAATDVWALALIAFELLVGVPYWEGNTAASLLERIPDGAQHPTPSTLAAARGIALSPAFDRWLLRCIDPDASKRPASAGDAVGDLLRVFDPAATQPPTRAAKVPVPPAPRELTDTHREVPQTVQMPAARPRPIARAGDGTPAKRPPGFTPTPPRPPPTPAPPAVDASADSAESERPTIPNNGRQIVSRVRPVTPKAPAPASEAPARPAPPAPPGTGRQAKARVRDAGEAKTIKMPTVRTPDQPRAGIGVRAGPMDTVPIPLARPAHHDSSGDGRRLGPMETRPIPLERHISHAAPPQPVLEVTPEPVDEHAPYTLPPVRSAPKNSAPQPAITSTPAPSQQPAPPQPAPSATAQPAPATQPAPSKPSPAPSKPSPAPAASTQAGPPMPPARVGTPAKPAQTPGDLLSERIAREAEASDAASALAHPHRRPDPHALTTVLPVVSVKPAQGISLTTIAVAGALSLGLTIAAGYVLLHRRVPEAVAARQTTTVTPTPPPTSGGLTVTDRTALRACAAQWSPALLAHQNADGGFGSAAGAPSSGNDTAQVFAALLRGHVSGAIVAPDRQLQILRALDASRLPTGWSASPSNAPQARASTSATAWAAIAFALMAEESHAETARARVRIARDALVTAQRPDGSFSDDMVPTARAASDAATALATWGLLAARRAAPSTDARVDAAASRASTWIAMRITSGALPTGLDALAFWALWQGRDLSPGARAETDALAPEFARSLLARCPAATGCPANIPSWEPWTSLAVASILRAPPATVDAPTRASLAALLELTLARFSRAREQVASAPSPALAPWLLAAGELQR